MSARPCPACGEAALITRTSRLVTLVTWQNYYACKVCNQTYTGYESLDGRLGEGFVPEAEHLAKVPLSPAAERQRARDIYRAERRKEPDDQLARGF